MSKLIRYARSRRQQSTDRQRADVLAAGVRRDDLYIDHGVSGARASRPQFDRALDALMEGDTLAITTLDRLDRSTQNMRAFAAELRSSLVDVTDARRSMFPFSTVRRALSIGTMHFRER